VPVAAVDCVAAPGPVIGWVLMIAGTVLVQLVLLPVLLAASGLLASGLMGLVAAMRRTLELAFGAPVLPVFARVRFDAEPSLGYAVSDGPHRTNPRRGPPSHD